jgi:hypothetical protein
LVALLEQEKITFLNARLFISIWAKQQQQQQQQQQNYIELKNKKDEREIITYRRHKNQK